MNQPIPIAKFPYIKVRYHCACQKVSHATYRLFDEMPPERCPAGQRLVRDSKYEDTEALDRIKAMNQK